MPDAGPEPAIPGAREIQLFDAGLLAMIHVADDWNREAARFIHHRLQAYSTLAADLGRCTTPPAVMFCCARFMSDTVEEYLREAIVAQSFARRAADETFLTAETVVMPAKAPVVE
jgi:hypothetical protein